MFMEFVMMCPQQQATLSGAFLTEGVVWADRLGDQMADAVVENVASWPSVPHEGAGSYRGARDLARKCAAVVSLAALAGQYFGKVTACAMNRER